MNYVYKKIFYSTLGEEIIKQKIVQELKRWCVDDLQTINNEIRFNFSIWKFGSNIKSFSQINKGYFKIINDSSLKMINYKGYYSITTELILIIFFILLGFLVFWFFFIVAVGLSIQLISRIYNLNNIQNEMIKRLSENE